MTMHGDDYHGVLVGWTSQDLGKRMVLHLQGVTTPAPHSPDDVDSFYFLMDKNQAVQLGNQLFKIAGQTPPRKRKKGWLDRMMGA
jgi:biofilm regulator BssS